MGKKIIILLFFFSTNAFADNGCHDTPGNAPQVKDLQSLNCTTIKDDLAQNPGRLMLDYETDRSRKMPISCECFNDSPETQSYELTNDEIAEMRKNLIANYYHRNLAATIRSSQTLMKGIMTDKKYQDRFEAANVNYCLPGGYLLSTEFLNSSGACPYSDQKIIHKELANVVSEIFSGGNELEKGWKLLDEVGINLEGREVAQLTHISGMVKALSFDSQVPKKGDIWTNLKGIFGFGKRKYVFDLFDDAKKRNGDFDSMEILQNIRRNNDSPLNYSATDYETIAEIYKEYNESCKGTENNNCSFFMKSNNHNKKKGEMIVRLYYNSMLKGVPQGLVNGDFKEIDKFVKETGNSVDFNKPEVVRKMLEEIAQNIKQEYGRSVDLTNPQTLQASIQKTQDQEFEAAIETCRKAATSYVNICRSFKDNVLPIYSSTQDGTYNGGNYKAFLEALSPQRSADAHSIYAFYQCKHMRLNQFERDPMLIANEMSNYINFGKERKLPESSSNLSGGLAKFMKGDTLRGLTRGGSIFNIDSDSSSSSSVFGGIGSSNSDADDESLFGNTATRSQIESNINSFKTSNSSADQITSPQNLSNFPPSVGNYSTQRERANEAAQRESRLEKELANKQAELATKNGELNSLQDTTENQTRKNMANNQISSLQNEIEKLKASLAQAKQDRQESDLAAEVAQKREELEQLNQKVEAQNQQANMNSSRMNSTRRPTARSNDQIAAGASSGSSSSNIAGAPAGQSDGVVGGDTNVANSNSQSGSLSNSGAGSDAATEKNSLALNTEGLTLTQFDLGSEFSNDTEVVVVKDFQSISKALEDLRKKGQSGPVLILAENQKGEYLQYLFDEKGNAMSDESGAMKYITRKLNASGEYEIVGGNLSAEDMALLQQMNVQRDPTRVKGLDSVLQRIR